MHTRAGKDVHTKNWDSVYYALMLEANYLSSIGTGLKISIHPYAECYKNIVKE